MKYKALIGLASLLLMGCETTELYSHSENVRIRWDASERLESCIDKGTVIGSEGSWYSFWFISNKALTDGALNDLKNQAAELGANTVDLYSPKPFGTSVTLMGNAYHCP
ncbi:DUF4156 domain-containing protein [Photobacterium sp. SDRW27]|uniref:DUF4156 domain-containing protein n=1 Tax=Photobacterium obscurum TaxID=2829490 RepID=UPI0022449B33|nr:DUF4156 domain-containing protein [Photobacterium obscurum]MCW8328122.1 DUF4156 domain-containing protein [Photobacterium obscurum]